jgi:hypothetical protein
MEWKCSSELGEVGRMKYTAVYLTNGAVAGRRVWELSSREEGDAPSQSSLGPLTPCLKRGLYELFSVEN